GGLTNNFGSVFDVHFGNAGHLVAIQGGTLLTSEDGGASWDPRWPETQGVYFDELHFPSEAIGYASGGISTKFGSAGSVVRTEDAGASWTLLDLAHGEIVAADFLDDDHGVVATQPGELWSTADRGDSWSLIGPTPDASLLMDLVHRD